MPTFLLRTSHVPTFIRTLNYSVPLAIGGLIGFWFGLKQFSLKKAIQYTPTSKAIAVAPGTAEVCGIAKPYKNALVSPFEKKPCAYYCTELSRWHGSGKHRKKTLVKKFESDQPVYLEDDTGRVLVQANTGTPGLDDRINIPANVCETKTLGMGPLDVFRTFKPDTESRFYKFVQQNVPELVSYKDKLEIAEKRIGIGEEYFALGKAKVFDEKATTPEMYIWNAPKSNFCLFKGNEKNALHAVNLWAMLGVLGGPLLVAAGVDLATLNPTYGIAAAALLYAILGIKNLVAMYNGLVLLKNSIDRADANIDALLQKRADLLPVLEQIVKEYSRYEKDTLTTLAKLRSQSGVGQGNKLLLALSEAYPKLGANKNYLDLQNQLVKMESQVAASRQYYNDSVTLYNTRLGSFPYLLFAGSVGFSPAQYKQVFK